MNAMVAVAALSSYDILLLALDLGGEGARSVATIGMPKEGDEWWRKVFAARIPSSDLRSDDCHDGE